MNCCSDFLSCFFGPAFSSFESTGFWDWLCGGELGVLVSAATGRFRRDQQRRCEQGGYAENGVHVFLRTGGGDACRLLKISRSGIAEQHRPAVISRGPINSPCGPLSICRLTWPREQGSIPVRWFLDASRGGKREHGNCTLQQSVAAPATVSGESASKLATGQPGRPDADSDPRARRPASAVTQPVGGASIRSGCSQR